MRRILVVDDDPGQLEIRRALLERAGWVVDTADTVAAARRHVESRPQIVLMDLRIPSAGDGVALIRILRAEAPGTRIVVLSGLPDDLGAPELHMVDVCLSKPVRTSRLLETLARLVATLLLFLLLAATVWTRDFAFRLERAAEVVAEIEMSSPGSDWAESGREAAIAELSVDGGTPHQVVLWAGAARYTYPAFLGPLGAGEHRLAITRETTYSAKASGFEVFAAVFREYRSGDSLHDVIAHAPALYARSDTPGRFSDVPLVVYCERLRDGGGEFLQYTVIFSNEDGGTSTRALMARWGRTTDIEWVYRVWPASGRAIYQAKDHKEIDFAGRREGAHPLLAVVTGNNMVSDQGVSPLRHQIAPVLVDLSKRSRETVMDEHPITWSVMAREMRREMRLRPFGAVEGEKAGDPRNYLYLDLSVVNHQTGVMVLARRAGESMWRSSDLGRADYSISRDGWVRTTVELPPGTGPQDIDQIAFGCVVVPDEKGKWPPSNSCRVEAAGRAFFLGADDRPAASFWSWTGPLEIPAGEVRAFTLPAARSTGTSGGTPPR